jgi:hypothetical protein
MGGETRFLHRLGNRARLFLGARQIVEEDSDVDPGSLGRRSSASDFLSRFALSLER